MKEVKQEILTAEGGDCLAACIASLLEIGLDEVPNFVDQDSWHSDMEAWLLGRGYTVLTVQGDGVCDALAIATGMGYMDCLHAVIYAGGELVWCPGSGRGIKSVDYYMYLLPRHARN